MPLMKQIIDLDPATPTSSFNGIYFPAQAVGDTNAEGYHLEDVLAEAKLNHTDTGVFWASGLDTPRIHRETGRMFLGAAVGMGDSRSNTNTTWVPDTASGANWAPRDSHLCVMTDIGSTAITGMSKVSQSQAIPFPPSSIGVAGYVINDGDYDPEPYPVAWAFYADVQHEPIVAGNSYGMEMALKNKGANNTANPYDRTSGVYGLWLAGGGANDYGGDPTYPANVGVMFLKSHNDLTSGFNVGINFDDESLTYTGGIAPAVRMAKGHALEWWASNSVTAGDGINAVGARIYSDVTVGGDGVYQVFDNDSVSFYGMAGDQIFRAAHVDGGVNHLVAYNAVAGGIPSIKPQGTDTDIGIYFQAKGSGTVRIDDGSANPRIRANTIGVAFNDKIPIAKPTLSAALSTGGSETNTNICTAYNTMRTALINYGLCL